jgi:DNA-binding response OmpR family regulator
MLDVALIARDDVLTHTLRRALEGMGSRVACYASLSDEPTLWQSRKFDLMIVHETTLVLDLGRIRMRDDHGVPFAAAIALLSEPHRVFAPELFDAGFDRCLPVSLDHDSLCAMVRALTRRRQGLTVSVCHYGPLSFNYVTQQACVSDIPLALTTREAQALEILLKRVGQIIPKERFIQDLALDERLINSNAAEVYIHRLRKKISDEILPIRNIKRCGYLLPRHAMPKATEELARPRNQLVVTHLSV